MTQAPLLHHVATPALARMYARALEQNLPATNKIGAELAGRLDRRLLGADVAPGARRLSDTLTRLAAHAAELSH